MAIAEPPKKRRIFVVHGRDLEAKLELDRLLEMLGFEVGSFEDTANDSGAMPVISEVVRRAIGEADAVVVLFTPDELAVLYDPKTGLLGGRDASRWQSRPNVIFEAGWAFGLKSGATIFVSVGEATALFSDIAGHHFVRLDALDGPVQLQQRLAEVFGELRAPADGWETMRTGATFRKLRSRRWDFHDELNSLHASLDNIGIPLPAAGGSAAEKLKTKWSRKTLRAAPQAPLLTLLREAVAAHADWSWRHRRPTDLIEDLVDRHGWWAADEAYWWLVTTGFFVMSQIERWGESFDDSIDHASFAQRGIALLEWLGARAKELGPASNAGVGARKRAASPDPHSRRKLTSRRAGSRSRSPGS
jgi:hypothetical protein